MRVTIDRFEGDYAVCEKSGGKMINISRLKLPQEAKEGDILLVIGEFIKIDNNSTNKQKTKIEELTKDLWE